MTVREIQQHLSEMYGTELSPTLISNVTDAVVEEVKQWQSRLFDSVYPVVYLIPFIYISPFLFRHYYMSNITGDYHMQGEKEVLGLWIAQSEGAKFWL